MRYKKYILLLITISLLISSCAYDTSESGSADDTPKSKYTMQYENGTKEEFEKEPNMDELNFYDTVDEALLDNKHFQKNSAPNVKKIIKILKKNDNAVVFFIADNNGRDDFYIYKIKVKNEGDKELYSKPILGTGWLWQCKLYWIRNLEKDKDKESALKAKVESDLMLFNGAGHLYTEKDKVLKWGLSIDEEIKDLKINGQHPTEIMNIKLDDDDVYFWYYEDCPVNTISDDVDISF